MIAVGLVVLVVVALYVRRRMKRGLVAGLDKPATWRQSPAGRVTHRRTEGL